MHPILELLLNPFAGAAGMNLLAIMFYIGMAMCALVIMVERSFHE